jgi:ribosomal protein S27E
LDSYDFPARSKYKIKSQFYRGTFVLLTQADCQFNKLIFNLPALYAIITGIFVKQSIAHALPGVLTFPATGKLYQHILVKIQTIIACIFHRSRWVVRCKNWFHASLKI